MTYSTGDTFGHADGKGEVIWVFKDATLAMKAKELWDKENAKRDPEFSIEFEADGGIMVKQSNPAAGYFENVGHIGVETFLVNP
jgi:outer membrane protein assembly factor BamB